MVLARPILAVNTVMAVSMPSGKGLEEAEPAVVFQSLRRGKYSRRQHRHGDSSFSTSESAIFWVSVLATVMATLSKGRD